MGKVRVKRGLRLTPTTGDERKDQMSNENTGELISILDKKVCLPFSTPTCSDESIPTSKKSRRKLRHQCWLQKLEGCKKSIQESELALARSKTAVVGDMQPLVTALPAVHGNDVAEGVTSSRNGKQEQRRTSSVLSDVDHFQRVLDHESFKQDPLSAIEEHVFNSVAKFIF